MRIHAKQFFVCLVIKVCSCRRFVFIIDLYPVLPLLLCKRECQIQGSFCGLSDHGTYQLIFLSLSILFYIIIDQIIEVKFLTCRIFYQIPVIHIGLQVQLYDTSGELCFAQRWCR